MSRFPAHTIDGDGRKTKVTSVRIDFRLWELVNASGKSLRAIVENAILREFDVGNSDSEELSEDLKTRIRTVTEERLRRNENLEHKVELVRQVVQDATAYAVKEEFETQLKEQKIQKEKEIHEQKLKDAWSAVEIKHHLTPRRIQRMLPENDIDGDYEMDWDALPSWLSKEAGATFTPDEILAYAKYYAIS